MQGVGVQPDIYQLTNCWQAPAAWIYGQHAAPKHIQRRLSNKDCRSTCVMDIRHLILVPQNGLSRIQRQLVDDLCLEAPSLIRADHDLHEKVYAVCPRIVL